LFCSLSLAFLLFSNEHHIVALCIGKSGGGSVRRRIASASLNFSANATNWYKDPGAYYPISVNQKIVKGKLCNGLHPNFLIDAEAITVEGTLPCGATTPLGHSIGCPYTSRRHFCDLDSASCPVVYIGHNWLGSEMHWLPARYLANWWRDYDGDEWIASKLESIHNESWCKDGLSAKNQLRKKRRPMSSYVENYETCNAPLEREADEMAATLFDGTTDWSPVLASMPVLRVTMLRDPFSWFISKFFWHSLDQHTTCENIEFATRRAGIFPLNGTWWDTPDPGWAHRMALVMILYICGEHCLGQLQTGAASLAEVVKQADGNLRHSFAVVGLLNESDTFYEMIDDRVSYMNMS
jgi:hypothetical protein